MPSNSRISVSKLHGIIIPQPPRPCVIPLHSVWQPATFHTPSSVRSRLNSSLTKGWRGTKEEDHAVNRSKKHDTTDPTTDASSSGMKDREESEGIANHSKPSGATERGGLQHERKAKKQHPKAPEPIIGMNDERGQVSLTHTQT
ncbi:hypothetical protein BDV59DRAFT_145018 [Aspergillus ambiguus]|uniref:uncharacterized protein n=1 Tax=Aspergillus ambiguus TaxID=176160 RepID=UPI003CCCE5CE